MKKHTDLPERNIEKKPYKTDNARETSVFGVDNMVYAPVFSNICNNYSFLILYFRTTGFILKSMALTKLRMMIIWIIISFLSYLHVEFKIIRQ